MATEIKVIDTGKINDLLHRWGMNITLITLFGGDRLSCCDEGVVLIVDGEEIGLATIAPKGEDCCCTSTSSSFFSRM